MSVKVARKGDAALGNAAGADSFSPPLSHLSHPPLYLFLCFCLFNVSSHSPLSPLSRSWSKESADTSAAARPPLSALFYFSWGGRASVESKRDREREGEKQRNYSVLPPPVSFSLISTSCPLLSHRADLHSSPSFPFNSPLLLPPLFFLSLPVLPCR